MRLAAGLSALAIAAGAAIVGATAATAGGYHVQYAFTGGSNAGHPHAAVTKYAGKLYGTTTNDGAHGFGAVYAFDPATGVETLVYSFKGGTDGAYPHGRLINVGGKFYGTTSEGGDADQDGTVFSLDPATGVETVLYAFTGGNDGDGPLGGLIDVGGLLYGTTELGGSSKCQFGCGVVFSIDPTTGAEATVHAFKAGHDGELPYSDLLGVDGILYGTTEGGGSGCAGGCGTVFSIDPSTGAESVVHAFKGGADGNLPQSSLIRVGGKLYGTTLLGGVSCTDYGCGVIFSVDPTTGHEKTVYSFLGDKDGSIPWSLVEVNGALYGTTEDDGHRRGTVFSLNLATGAETVLHAFRGGADGDSPQAGLFYDGKRLWGTTNEAGASGYGTLFSIAP